MPRYSVVVVALALLGCSEADAGDDPSDPPEGERLFWLDPARCIDPCSYHPGTHLVAVDEDGQVAADGARSFAAHAQPSLAALIAAAKSDGEVVLADSGFRTYATQVAIYGSVTEIGRAARPGHSEHQIGTAIDFGFDGASAEAWLAEHAWEHGFVQSYPPGKQKITGLRTESWHYRWVGAAIAAEIHGSGWALQEWFIAHPERGRSGDCAACPNEASRSECGALSAEGECAGTVLRWCFDGALAEVDCALDGAACLPAATGFDCVLE